MSDKYVVVFDAVGNYPRGARVTADDLYHADMPGRDAQWRRLVDLGAVKPGSDEEAKAIPVAYASVGTAPILPVGGEKNLTAAFVPDARTLPPTVDRYTPLPEQAEKQAIQERQPAVQAEGELKPTPERATRAAR